MQRDSYKPNRELSQGGAFAGRPRALRGPGRWGLFWSTSPYAVAG